MLVGIDVTEQTKLEAEFWEGDIPETADCIIKPGRHNPGIPEIGVASGLRTKRIELAPHLDSWDEEADGMSFAQRERW